MVRQLSDSAYQYVLACLGQRNNRHRWWRSVIQQVLVKGY